MLARGLTIGRLTLPNRAFLAPMAGITDRPMRRLAERFGAGLVVSEMIASAALSTGHAEMVRKLRKAERLPHVVQLAGCEPQWMALGARIAAEAGADIVDINLGCPAKRVTNSFAGSALMRVPDLAQRLIEAVIGAVNLPVTVKMRLGWDEASPNAPDMARRAVDAGAQMITVHARTREQFYKGVARWPLVRPVVEAVPVPVVVNGDIVDSATASEALAQSGAAAVMIGRGAQGRPWLVGQIGGSDMPEPEGDDLANLVAEHYEAMLTEYGAAVGMRASRKHLDWYLEGQRIVAPDLRRAMLASEQPAQVLGFIRTLFGAPLRAAA